MAQVIYISPNCNIDIKRFAAYSDKEKVHTALHDYNIRLYRSLLDFQDAFNNGYISDEGYVFFIDFDLDKLKYTEE